MGAQLREYRSRIQSAQTTKKITRAMELIAASRIQKALDRAGAFSPFEIELTRAVSAVATRATNLSHPLVTEREDFKRSAVVVLSSDRGLAGAFNSNVIKNAERLGALLTSQGKQVDYYLVGRKAVGYFKFRQIPFVESWTGMTDAPTAEVAYEIREAVLKSFLAEDGAGEIHLVYNEYVNMMVQDTEILRLLPLKVVEKSSTEDYPSEVFPMYEFEPDMESVLDALLPEYIGTKILSAMLQSAAAKQAATQKAMKSASDNADKLITNFTRLANTARQAEITQQITEIVGGADALVDDKDE